MKPVTIACSLTRVRIAVRRLLVKPIVPGNCADASFTVNGSTGIAIALPSFSAIAFTVAFAISEWPPFTACGPRCSVPPV